MPLQQQSTRCGGKSGNLVLRRSSVSSIPHPEHKGMLNPGNFTSITSWNLVNTTADAFSILTALSLLGRCFVTGRDSGGLEFVYDQGPVA